MTAPSPWWLDDDNPRDSIRWVASGVMVGAVYAGAIAAYLLCHPAQSEIGDDNEVVTLELAPIDSTPDATAQDVAPAPETMIESKAEPTPQPEKPPEPEAKIEPPPPDDTPTAIPELQPKPPEKVEEARPPAPVTAERVKGGAPHVEASWQTELVRRLQRYKRYPGEARARAEQGVVFLNFSLDRSGHVLNRKISRSSGYPDLDAEVIAMIERADPLPAFPPSMPQTQIDLTVPIRFSLR
jgi:periplasmic protein TonB